MAALRAAKQALRKEIKRRIAALSDCEKQRQSLVVSRKVRGKTPTELTTADEALLAVPEQALSFPVAYSQRNSALDMF